MTPPTTHSNNDPTNKTDPLGLRPSECAFSRAASAGGFDPCADQSFQGWLDLFGNNAALCTPRIPSPFGEIQACVDPGGVIDAVNPFDDIIELLAKYGDAALLFVLEQVARVVAASAKSGTGTPSPLGDAYGAVEAALSEGKIDWFCGTSPYGLPINCVENDDRRTGDVGKEGTTLGHWIFCDQGCEFEGTYIHEYVHVGQSDEFGDLWDLLLMPLATKVDGSNCNRYEREAYAAASAASGGKTC